MTSLATNSLAISDQTFSNLLAKSYEYCVSAVRESGSNFYYGMLLTAKNKRLAMFAIYTWMREIDDIADSTLEKQDRIKKLVEFYQKTKTVVQPDFKISHEVPLDKHWLAFRQTILEYKIPLRYFRDMLHGQLQAVKQNQFKTFTELYQYCYRVASTVGLICISIWGYSGGAATKKLAEYRGIALQLTNILRDIRNDAIQGQVYIPEEFFKNKNDVSVQAILTKDNFKTLKNAINKVIDKTDYYYEMSHPLEHYVEDDGLLCLRVMTSFYYALFKKIKRKPTLIFSRNKMKLNKLKKIFICLGCFFNLKRVKQKRLT